MLNPTGDLILYFNSPIFSVYAHRISLAACRKRDGFISQDGRPSCSSTPPPFKAQFLLPNISFTEFYFIKSCVEIKQILAFIEYNFDWSMCFCFFFQLQNNQLNELAPPTPVPSWLNWKKNFILIVTYAGHVGLKWPLCSTWPSAKSKSGSRIAAWNSKKNKREAKEAAVVVGTNHPVHPLARL